MTDHVSPMMSIDELAEVLGVSAPTIRGWRRAGEGPPAYRIGGQLRYSTADVAAWLATRRIKPGDPQ